jgi:hypothetical protein
MMKRVLTLAVATALALTGPAMATKAKAADDTALANAKRLTIARIDGRLAALKVDGVAIRNAARLSDGHQSAIQAILDKDIAGLTALRTKVEGETTGQAVKDDARSMVVDYRVYMLVGPQVRLTIAADVANAVDARLGEVAGKLAAAIEKAKAAGQDVTAAQAKLDHMKAELAAANVDGVADALIATQPSPDAAAMKAAKDAARSKLREARQHLKNAAADAKACAADLRA